jgi:hypothetical protein
MIGGAVIRTSPTAFLHLLSIVLTMVSGAAGCGTAQLTELQRIRSADRDVVLLADHEAIRHGSDTFIIEFRNADGNLVDVGTVKASASMPMPGMPMFGSVDMARTDVAGRYSARARLEMAGTWRMVLEWDGPRGRGSVAFSGMVR